MVPSKTLAHPWQRRMMLALHIAVLGGCGLLLVLISANVLKGHNFLLDPFYRHTQTWVCLLFLADIAAEVAVSPRHWHYAARHILFIIIAIPWTTVLGLWHLGASPHHAHILYILQYIPLLRVAYVIYLIAGAMQGNRVKGMFAGYLSLLVAVVYMSSLIFFLEERAVNGLVTTYWDSLYWSYMNLTTTGCDIPAFTTTGKILNVLLPAGGLVLFPVFTVYITRSVQRTMASSASAKSPARSSTAQVKVPASTT